MWNGAIWKKQWNMKQKEYFNTNGTQIWVFSFLVFERMRIRFHFLDCCWYDWTITHCSDCQYPNRIGMILNWHLHHFLLVDWYEFDMNGHHLMLVTQVLMEWWYNELLQNNPQFKTWIRISAMSSHPIHDTNDNLI